MVSLLLDPRQNHQLRFFTAIIMKIDSIRGISEQTNAQAQASGESSDPKQLHSGCPELSANPIALEESHRLPIRKFIVRWSEESRAASRLSRVNEVCMKMHQTWPQNQLCRSWIGNMRDHRTMRLKPIWTDQGSLLLLQHPLAFFQDYLIREEKGRMEAEKPPKKH